MKLKSILASFFRGGVKAIPIVGNIATELKDNKENDAAHAPKGSIDYARILGYVIVGSIVLAVIFGKIPVDDAKALINKLGIYSLLE